MAVADTSGSAHSLTEDPRLFAFLPPFYVAWADGELTPEEIAAIGDQALAVEGLEDCCQDALERWLDPERPPTAQELQKLLSAIRRQSASLSLGERRTMAELGVELARVGGHEPAPAEIEALERLETALSLPSAEVTRALVVKERPVVPEPVPSAAAFEPHALRRWLDGDRHALRQEVRELLAQPEMQPPAEVSKEEYREWVLARCRTLAERRYGALALPEEVGGKGDIASFVAVFETLALGDLSLVVKFGVQFGLFAGSIHQLGTDKHHQKYLPAAASLELPGCFAMTETGHGSNVADLETVARFDRATDEFEIHSPTQAARKDYIGNAARHGRLATVFAQLEIDGEGFGVHAFLVPIRDESGNPMAGVEIGDCGKKLGLNGVDNGRLLFDRVRVPREALLDRFAQVSAEGEYTSPIVSPSKRFFTMLGTLVGGRVSVARAALSASKVGLAIAVRYGDRRRQFGAPGEPETRLLDYVTHQRRLMPLVAEAYALHFALDHLVERFAASQETDGSGEDTKGEARREVETLAAALKSVATWHATDSLQTCREACGGQGYLAVNRFADLKADSDIFTTFEGDNTVLLQLVAKSLLGGYRHMFGSFSTLRLARYLIGRVATHVVETNPVITRKTDEVHLRDREFQRGAFRWREERMLATVAQRLKKRIDDGMESQQALIDCQDHLVALAKAHAERIVLDRFAEAVDGTPEPELRAVLSLLCDLYALHRLEQDRAWFLERGYFESNKAKAIRDLVNALCLEARQQAVPLVDAFGIPDAVLAAPIAFDGGQIET
ncbi:MAG: acyl-CoA dehydrogenase [Acidobacteriota bacterium]